MPVLSIEGLTKSFRTRFPSRVIEAVTGQKWQDYLRDEIFTPTGMTRTTAYASRMYDPLWSAKYR